MSKAKTFNKIQYAFLHQVYYMKDAIKEASFLICFKGTKTQINVISLKYSNIMKDPKYAEVGKW